MRISKNEVKRLLLDNQIATEQQIKDAEVIFEQTKEPFDVIVVRQNLISERDLVQLYAKSIDVPYADLSELAIPREILLKIPERIARKYQAVLFGTEDNKLLLAMADPEDYQAADFIEKQAGFRLKIYVATPEDIAVVLNQYKGSLDNEITAAIQESSDGSAAAEEMISAKDIAEDAPIAKTVNLVLEYAVRARASDIHIEPRENMVQVRYRIDGILKEAMTLPRTILLAIVSRVKILANLKIDEHRVPQDGRFKVKVAGKTIALRVSTLPIMDGEKVVMRILDESTRAQTLEELGFDGPALEAVKRSLYKPHGMTLVTGPTGSGKSTTLYSILNVLNTPGVNISTIEDPVEYRAVGVNQTQVNPKTGMTFANGLRALLRQDPNIIMVGEIRDGETADLAVQAALTGHVVLSTLHTNNAATTLPRLLDMGVEPFLIASTVNNVIGQRLVRRLCDSCKKAYKPAGQALEDIKKEFDVESAFRRLKNLENKPGPETPAAPMAAGGIVAQDVPMESLSPSRSSGRKAHEKILAAPSREEIESKSILDRIAADPNIINRPAEAKESEKPAPTTAPEPVVKPIEKIGEFNAGDFNLYKPVGCDKCGTSGYVGRVGIYEVLEITTGIQQMIMNHSTADDIQLAAVKNGMLTMQQDGFIKAIAGLTTIEEILRVTRE